MDLDLDKLQRQAQHTLDRRARRQQRREMRWRQRCSRRLGRRLGLRIDPPGGVMSGR